MRTLSIRQPWAWLILRPDLITAAERAAALAADVMKPVENRDWSTDYRGEFLIHVGKGIVQRDYIETAAYLQDEFGIVLPHWRDLDYGGIVGVARLVDVVRSHRSRFFMGPFGFVLADARPLPFMPCKGQLGWFDVPRPAAMEVSHAL